MAEIAIISAIVSAASLGVSVVSSVKAQKAGKARNDEIRRQNALEKRKADIRSARDRVNLVRKSRIARAQVVAAAENSGTSGGSGVAGGTSSIGAQLASNLGTTNQLSGINAQISASKDLEASALSRAAKAQAIGGVADSIFGVAVGIAGESGAFED